MLPTVVILGAEWWAAECQECGASVLSEGNGRRLLREDEREVLIEGDKPARQLV